MLQALNISLKEGHIKVHDVAILSIKPADPKVNEAIERAALDKSLALAKAESDEQALLREIAELEKQEALIERRHAVRCKQLKFRRELAEEGGELNLALAQQAVKTVEQLQNNPQAIDLFKQCKERQMLEEVFKDNPQGRALYDQEKERQALVAIKVSECRQSFHAAVSAPVPSENKENSSTITIHYDKS